MFLQHNSVIFLQLCMYLALRIDDQVSRRLHRRRRRRNLNAAAAAAAATSATPLTPRTCPGPHESTVRVY
jgi:hypothetical protein